MSLSSWFPRFTLDPFVTLKNSPSKKKMTRKSENFICSILPSCRGDQGVQSVQRNRRWDTKSQTLVCEGRFFKERTTGSCLFLPVPRLHRHQEDPGKEAQASAFGWRPRRTQQNLISTRGPTAPVGPTGPLFPLAPCGKPRMF